MWDLLKLWPASWWVLDILSRNFILIYFLFSVCFILFASFLNSEKHFWLLFFTRVFSSVLSQVLQLWGVRRRRSPGLQQLRALQWGHVGGGDGRTLDEAFLWEPLGGVLLKQGQIGACSDRHDGGGAPDWLLVLSRPSHTNIHSPLPLRLPGARPSHVYYLMYRYICIDFWLFVCYPFLTWSNLF